MSIPRIPKRELQLASITRPHVVLLGAGASRAAFPDGDRNGRKLPLMCDFVETLALERTLNAFGMDYVGRNFEDVYGELYRQPGRQEEWDQIENHIRDYFSAMALPDAPTLYDHLVLSLREKDVIATFNWDPFLFQACARNCKFAKPPRLIFLHGNVAIGYCPDHRVKGPAEACCWTCGRPYIPSRLLYPVSEKNYTSDPFIRSEWTGLQSALSNAFVFTIFGYSAPQSDVEAIGLLKEGWGRPERRELEQVEIIDIIGDDALREKWDAFILEHHYDTAASFYKSWVARHPRRSCDAVWRQIMELEFLTDNMVPVSLPFDEQHTWYRQLLDAESEDGE